jgi:hypothetical protein
MIAGGVEEPLAAHPRGAGADHGDHRLQARPDGLRGVSRRHPRHLEGGVRAGLSGRGLQRARRRRRVSCPASCAAGCATSRSRPAAPTPTPAALSRSRGCCARSNTDLGRSCSTFCQLARRIAPCAATKRSTISIGRRPGAPSPPGLMALAIDHRAQLETDRRRRRRAARAYRALQAPGGRGRRESRGRTPRLRHAARRQIWPRGAVPRRRPEFLDRSAGGAPGSRPLDFEFGGSLAAKLIEWPIGHTVKCLCFYHPDDPAAMKAQQERELMRLYDARAASGASC